MPTTTTTLRWAGGFRFEGAGIYGHPIATDAVKTIGGAESGHKPTELLLWGLASCTGIDVLLVLKKQRQELTDLEIEVTGHNNDEYPRPFHTIDVTYRAKGHNLDANKFRQAVDLSESKYCIVSQTLQNKAEVRTHIEIQESDEKKISPDVEIQFTPISATIRTQKSVDAVSVALQEIGLANGFRTLAVHDVQQTLAEKGFERGPLRIIEICNASFAHRALEIDMNVALFMPCRFTVYQDTSATVITLARPSMIAQVIPDAELTQMSADIEAELLTIMKEAAQ